MGEYVKMPKSDYKAICDSIRSGTGVLGAIVSGDIPDTIAMLTHPLTPIEETGQTNEVAEALEKDINFYNYDGTRLYSYTLAEANDNNWTIPTAPISTEYPYNHWCVNDEFLLSKKPFTQPLDIGLIRRSTQSPGVKLWINISTENQKYVQLYINGSKKFTIDWGDNSSQLISDGSAPDDTPYEHNYITTGNYIIHIIPTENNTIILGNTAADTSTHIYSMFGDERVNATNFGHAEILTKIEINEQVTEILPSALYGTINLQEISVNNNTLIMHKGILGSAHKVKFLTLPSTVDLAIFPTGEHNLIEKVCQPFVSYDIASYSLQQAQYLHHIPSTCGATSIGAYAYQHTTSDMHDTYIPEGVTSIGQGAYQVRINCPKYYLPSTLTSIAQLAFRQNPGVREYHIAAVTPPTLANANAFNAISAECKIIVPSGSLSDYQTATNWSVYADYMEEAN